MCSRGRLLRFGRGGKEICRIRDHSILHDGLRGRFRGRTQRVLAKGAAGPHNQRLNGLTAAFLHLGVVGAKVYVKGCPGPGCTHLHRRDDRGRRLRLGKRLAEAVCGRFRLGCLLCGRNFRFHFLGHLVAPAADAAEPVRQADAECRALHILFRFFLVLCLIFGFVVVLFCLLLRCPGSSTLSPALGVALGKSCAPGMGAAKRRAQPLPDLRRGQVKDVQAGTERQHDHDQVCRRASAQQQQIAAQQCTQCTAADPGIHTILVTCSHHLEGRKPLRLDAGKDDDRAAGKNKSQRQLENFGQKIFAPGVLHSKAAYRRAQHKAAAAKQAEQHIMQRTPGRVPFHEGQHDQQKPRKQGAKPCRETLFCAFFPR